MQCLHLKGPLKCVTLGILENAVFSIKMWSDYLCVFPEGVVHECGNMVLVIIGLFDVTSCAVVTPLRLLVAKHDLYMLH